MNNISIEGSTNLVNFAFSQAAPDIIYEVYIKGGYNQITSGSYDDYYEINRGNNVINGGSGNDTLEINGGLNNVNTGSGNDIININGGNNSINAGSGKDIITIIAGSNVINGANDNDTYKVDLIEENGFDFTNGDIYINDISGKNILDLTIDSTDSINLFFDVELKKDKKGKVISKKGNNSYNYSEMTFTTEDIDSDVNGIDVINNKSITTVKINNKDCKLSVKDINALAQNVVNWLTSGGRGYASTEEAFQSNDANIGELVGIYGFF